MKELLTEWRKYTTKALNEQVPPAAQQEPAAAGAEGAGKPAINLTNQTSFKEFAGKPELAAQVMNNLVQGGELFKQLQAALGEWAPKSPEVIQKWVQGIGGIAVFAKRAAAVGAKIPNQGLAKKDMPFLPGPDDAQGEVADEEDALGPGGKYNVDIVEKMAPPPPNTFVGLDDPAAAKYMQSGHNDGKPQDDTIGIKIGGEFAAESGIPTQTNILFPKALGMAINGVAGGNLGAYASMKGHILDGHHRCRYHA